MSTIKSNRTQLGLSGTATQNFTLTAEAADGTMKLARGNAGATTQDVLTVDTDGRVAHGLVMGMVRLNTANGYGSTNTKIRRFTNVVTNQGSDITYADSATLGASFTINKAGVYVISYNDQYNAAGTGVLGVSLNSAQLTTSITGINVGDVLCAAGGGSSANSNVPLSCGGAFFLPAGSLVRAHTDGFSSGTSTTMCQFTITRVA